jgi:chromosome segregation ATPase
VHALDLDNFGSDWHTWVTDSAATGRRETMRANAYKTSIRAPLAEVAGLRAEAEALRADQQRATAELAALAEDRERLRDRMRRLRDRVAGLRAKLERERARNGQLRVELETYRNSRLNRAARRAAAWLPRRRG